MDIFVRSFVCKKPLAFTPLSVSSIWYTLIYITSCEKLDKISSKSNNSVLQKKGKPLIINLLSSCLIANASLLNIYLIFVFILDVLKCILLLLRFFRLLYSVFRFLKVFNCVCVFILIFYFV